MCDEWLNNYQSFENWCLTNGFEEGLAIDRIDNDKGYSPDNCRFVTAKENNQNRRTTRFYTINGETRNLQQWCDYYSINRGTVVTRLKNGYSIEDALTKPLKIKKRDPEKLIGCRFGRLVVIKCTGIIGSDNNYRWLCQCDCGNTSIVSGSKLTTGHTNSCGCLQRDKAKKRMLEDNPMKRKD